MIASVDFLDPELDRVLENYASTGHVRCVRQHLGWHPTNPALRFATRPDLLSDDVWRGRIAALRGLVCELEVFSSQLRDLVPVAVAYPDIQFVLPMMGWPIDLTDDGRRGWTRALAALSACSNVSVKIFGMHSLDRSPSTTVDSRDNRDIWPRPVHVREPYATMHAGLQHPATL